MVRVLAAAASAILLTVSTAIPVGAADGVIEINQAIALAGRVNGDLAADPPGFPVRITQPGSYRLTGNLTIPPGTTGIQIDAANVTLDLGGFVVRGPNACTGYPTASCTVVDGNTAIVSEQFLVVVRNGSVWGSEGAGIALAGASSEVDQVRVLGCGGNGIDVGGAARVSRSFSGSNYRHGIELDDGSVAEDNEARANRSNGISILPSRLSSAVIGNRAFDNTGHGIAIPFNTLLSGNVASNNGASQISGVGRSLGNNLCADTLC